jgi:uncharacterized membrane protein
MFSAWEIVFIIVILAWLFVIWTRRRAGSLALYATVGLLVLALILSARIIRSLLGWVVLLALLCGLLILGLVGSYVRGSRELQQRSEAKSQSDAS